MPGKTGSSPGTHRTGEEDSSSAGTASGSTSPKSACTSRSPGTC